VKYRKLGSAGLKVSAVSLGGWTTFGESIQDQDLTRQIITTAYDNGINFFDNADVYARGESEKMMGQALKNFPRHTLVISSKVFGEMSDDVNDHGLSRKHIMESIDKSLQRLGTDYLDIYFCHRFDPDTSVEEVVRAMDDLIHRGKILYWGTSKWPAEKIEAACDFAQQHNLYAPQVEQTGYHMLRRQRLETEVLPVTEPRGIGITSFSPLANGLLTGKYDETVPTDSRYGRRDNLDEKFDAHREKVRQLKPIADGLGISRAQLAVAWCLRWPSVSSVIAGATKPAQVEDNVKAVDVELPEDVVAKIDEMFPIQPWP